MFDINNVPDFDAQASHMGWGGFLTLALAQWFPLWAAVVVVVGISFGKEALEALGIAPWEPKQTWSSSMVDFAFFSAGIGLAAVLHLI